MVEYAVAAGWEVAVRPGARLLRAPTDAGHVVAVPDGLDGAGGARLRALVAALSDPRWKAREGPMRAPRRVRREWR